MSYLNRVWMAASVAVVNGHPDQGQKWKKSGFNCLQHGKNRLYVSVGGDPADLRPLAGVLDSDLHGFLLGCNVEEGRNLQADESVRQVMYLSCWGQV